MFIMLIKHSLGLILINVLETSTTVSKRSHNISWILEHNLYNYFCTELATKFFCSKKDKPEVEIITSDQLQKGFKFTGFSRASGTVIG